MNFDDATATVLGKIAQAIPDAVLAPRRRTTRRGERAVKVVKMNAPECMICGQSPAVALRLCAGCLAIAAKGGTP